MFEPPSTNCKNCGAPLVDGYCEYCKTRHFYVNPVKFIKESIKKAVDVFKPTSPKVDCNLFIDDVLVGSILSFTDLQTPSMSMIETTTWSDCTRTYGTGLCDPPTITIDIFPTNLNQLTDRISNHNFKLTFGKQKFSFKGYIGDFSITNNYNELLQITLTIVATEDFKIEDVS